MNFQPELMRFQDGTEVKSPCDWEKRRKELVKILEENLYGATPVKPASVTGAVPAAAQKCCSGHAVHETVEIAFDTPKGSFKFPLELITPTGVRPAPLFLLINFRRGAYDMYFPTEEIIDNGFALGVIYYEDITADNGDFGSGLAAMYDREGPCAWGKIGMWAFAMSRAIDYLETRPEIDKERIAAIGHSRLGKTALWCAAQDERVKYVCSNDSGCCGASMERTRHEGGETLARITSVFPFWFCENALKNVGHEQEMPFDQHFLLAACAPRYVMVGSASLDNWADQYSEQLCCTAASPAWELLGKKGYTGPETPANVGDDFNEGDIAYHLRDGIHFLGRADWQSYMEFVKKH